MDDVHEGREAKEAEGKRDRVGLTGMASHDLPLCLGGVVSPHTGELFSAQELQLVFKEKAQTENTETASQGRWRKAPKVRCRHHSLPAFVLLGEGCYSRHPHT